jgi:hypothetical protein
LRSDNFTNGFVWLGVVAATLSTIKALNAFLDFGFKGIWADILKFYTGITEPFRVLVSKIPFVVDAPIWLPDVLLLYGVLVMTGFRSTVLPYRFDDYYRMHNIRRTFEVEFLRHADETFDEFFERQSEFVREAMISCEQRDDKFVAQLQEIIPRWELVFRQSLKCLTLWPAISLEPFRKMDNSIRFVRKLLKKSDSAAGMIEYESEGRRGFYAKWALEVDKIRLDGFLQIISLPVLVALFLIGATYIN